MIFLGPASAGFVRSLTKRTVRLLVWAWVPLCRAADKKACAIVPLGELNRLASMKTFRLLYFRESVLLHAQEVQGRDVVDAVGMAAGQPPEVRVEVWSEKGRVGIIGPSPSRLNDPLRINRRRPLSAQSRH